MSEQRPDELLARLKRVTVAAIRTNPRPEARQQLQELLTDLESFEGKLRELSAPAQEKQGEGKGVLETTLVGGALLLILSYMVVQACMQILSQQCYEALMQSDAGAQVANALGSISLLMYVHWTMLRARLRQQERTLPAPPPCFRPPFDCCLAALEIIYRVSNGPRMDMPTGATRANLLVEFNTLQRCLGDLIRCLDPGDVSGVFNALVGERGVVTMTIERFRLWRPPNIVVPRPGTPPAPPLH